MNSTCSMTRASGPTRRILLPLLSLMLLLFVAACGTSTRSDQLTNSAPEFISEPELTAQEGQPYSYTVGATDAEGDALSFTAPTLPAWLSLTANTNGTATLAGTASAAEMGDHEVTLEVSDGELSSKQVFTLTVIVWPMQFGTSEFDAGLGIAADADGNIYVVGYTYGAFAGQDAAGARDAFVAKCDSDGNIVWVRQFGTSEIDDARSVAVDASDNIYVSGFTEGALDGQAAAGGKDAFVAKYDSDGNMAWVRQFGTSEIDEGRSVAVDASDNIYVSGFTEGALDGPAFAGGKDAFLAKYDSDGGQTWVRQFGTTEIDDGTSVAVDKSNNIYVGGTTRGAFAGETYTGSGGDAFLASFDGDGYMMWVSQFGTERDDQVGSVITDTDNNVYVAGDTLGAFPGHSSLDGGDIFLAKYDGNGAMEWVRQFGTSGGDDVGSVVVDPSNNAYVVGRTDYAFAGQTFEGDVDAFVAKYDSNGEATWVRQFGTGRSDPAFGAAFDANGSLYLAGYTDGTFAHQELVGAADVFIHRMRP